MTTYTYTDARTTKMRELFVAACNALNALANYSLELDELEIARRAHRASEDTLHDMRQFHSRITFETDK